MVWWVAQVGCWYGKLWYAHYIFMVTIWCGVVTIWLSWYGMVCLLLYGYLMVWLPCSLVTLWCAYCGIVILWYGYHIVWYGGLRRWDGNGMQEG